MWKFKKFLIKFVKINKNLNFQLHKRLLNKNILRPVWACKACGPGFSGLAQPGPGRPALARGPPRPEPSLIYSIPVHVQYMFSYVCIYVCMYVIYIYEYIYVEVKNCCFPADSNSCTKVPSLTRYL